MEENVEPGPKRDAMLQHWYRGKVLKRLSGRIMLGYTEEYRQEFLDVVRPFTLERFGPEVDQYLAFPMRVRSALLRANDVEGLLELARIESELKSSAQVASISWDDSKRLQLEIESRAFFPDGSELEFEPTDSGWRWRPPPTFTSEVFTDDLLDVGSDLAGSKTEVFVRARHDSSDYVQPQDGPAPLPGPGLIRSTVTIDPRNARSGRSMTKFSDLIAQVSYSGWNFGTSVRIDPELLAQAELSERTIGKRAFAVKTRGANRLFVEARKLPPPPPKAAAAPKKKAVVKPPPPLSTRVVSKAKGLVGVAGRRIRKIMS